MKIQTAAAVALGAMRGEIAAQAAAAVAAAVTSVTTVLLQVAVLVPFLKAPPPVHLLNPHSGFMKMKCPAPLTS
jgi:hypothetical protein